MPHSSLDDPVFSLEATLTEFSWRKLKTIMKCRTQDWECTTTGISSYHLKLYLHTMNKVFPKFTLFLSFFHWFKTNKLYNLHFNVLLYIQDAGRFYHSCLTITISDILFIFQLFWDGLADWARCSLHTYLVSQSNFW